LVGRTLRSDVGTAEVDGGKRAEVVAGYTLSRKKEG